MRKSAGDRGGAGALERFTPRVNFPYLVGVQLAVNAVRDAFLVVDGPDCMFLKARHIVGRHDLRSTLLDPSGDHRVAFTGSKGKGGEASSAADLAARVSRLPSAGVVVVTASTPCAYPADGPEPPPFETPGGGAPVVRVPGRSLEGDWLDGYAETMAALASALPAGKPGRLDASAVAVVGLVTDRGEGDGAGNVGELGRLISALRLRPAAPWLGGARWRDLARAVEAGTVVSLPGGRKAARIISQRTGARLVETDLPLGLEATTAWIRQVAAAAGSASAGEMIDIELGRAVPALERAVPAFFLGRRFFLCGDPFTVAGLRRMIVELGGKVTGGILTATRGHLDALDDKGGLERFVFEPPSGKLESLRQAALDAGVDVVLTSSELLDFWREKVPCVNLGFPSWHHHVFAPTPFLGYEGCLHLAGRIADAVLEAPPAVSAAAPPSAGRREGAAPRRQDRESPTRRPSGGRRGRRGATRSR